MNSSLNSEQVEAAMHREGSCIVSACPGSGKTKVVTHRAATMIKEGIDPRSILLITFTNKAAKEMKSRLAALCGKNGLSGANDVTVSTFHALCAQFLRYGIFKNAPTNNYSILDEDEALSLMTEIADEHGIDRENAKLIHWTYASWRETEDGWMGQNIDRSFREEQVICIEKYEAAMKANNAVDFAGLISHVARGLSTDEEARKRLSSRYRYVVVDEAQDTNDAQFKIAMTIAGHGNIMIVGDADQAIYEWRGAKPENMFQMQRNIAGCKLIRLQTNYRSTASITDPASALISKNRNRLNEDIKPSKGDGSPVAVSVFLRREDESSEICKRVKVLQSRGVPLQRMAILFRTNSQSRAFEMSLRQFEIPYKLTGAFKFLDREEIKDAMSMLRFAVNPRDSISLGRFVNRPRRDLGPSVVSILAPRLCPGGHAETAARIASDPAFSVKHKNNLKSVFEAFSDISASSDPGTAVEVLISKLQYRRHLDLTVKNQDVLADKNDNLNELIRYAQSFSEQKQGNLRDFCTSLSLADDGSDDKKSNALNLMSIHASKGLEFHTVFIVCCEDGSIPHERSIKDLNPSKIDEERRLMYVAMTRAEEKLCISMSLLDGRSRDANNQVKAKRYSRFLEEAGLMDRQSFESKVCSLREGYQ
jgi:DNA helicase-2/ATP-dependent DNA helicase PcrA